VTGGGKPRFPSPIYAETVLAVNLRDAQDYFLDHLLEIHYAHTLMLAKQKIISRESAAACLAALDQLDRQALRTIEYDGRFEDLFFAVHTAIEERSGEENGGRMHTARSRNDIAIALYRMRLRAEVIELAEAVYQVVRVLVGLSRKHMATVMPAYTHTQPAQPTTLAHYLLGAIECFLRDLQRLKAAFTTINRNPLGACAITTTGFPIDRAYTMALLGFEGLQLNSYGAIASTDYVTETAGVSAPAMVNVGKLVQDLLQWCNPAFDFLRLSDAWVQISSIMPQKRNPVALEHTRILASRALGEAQAVFTSTHNTPFGDIVDSEDDLQPLVFTMTTDALRALRLFAGLMSDCEIHVARMAERSRADFLTVTELADTLVREENLSFHAAHRLVSAAVHELAGNYSPEGMIDAVRELASECTGKQLQTERALLLRALDPGWFVEIRTVAGGPAREPMKAALREAEAQLAQACDWFAEKRALLTAYPKRIRSERGLV
jgi:argininosuccinate lyase